MNALMLFMANYVKFIADCTLSVNFFCAAFLAQGIWFWYKRSQVRSLYKEKKFLKLGLDGQIKRVLYNFVTD